MIHLAQIRKQVKNRRDKHLLRRRGGGRHDNRRRGRAAFLRRAQFLLPDQPGQHKRNGNCRRHGEGKRTPELRIDGKNAGNTADANTERLHAAADRNNRHHCRANHAANERETIFRFTPNNAGSVTPK